MIVWWYDMFNWGNKREEGCKCVTHARMMNSPRAEWILYGRDTCHAWKVGKMTRFHNRKSEDEVEQYEAENGLRKCNEIAFQTLTIIVFISDSFKEGILTTKTFSKFSQIYQKIHCWLLPNSMDSIIMNPTLISDTANQCRFLYELVAISGTIVAAVPWYPPPQWNCVKESVQWVSWVTMGQYCSDPVQWSQTTRRSFPCSQSFDHVQQQ